MRIQARYPKRVNAHHQKISQNAILNFVSSSGRFGILNQEYCYRITGNRNHCPAVNILIPMGLFGVPETQKREPASRDDDFE